MSEKSNFQEFTKGFWQENPLFVIMLGCCPALATSTSISNAIGMSIAATAVLLGSNIIISIIRDIVPNKIRIPVYIVVIATFVTMVDKFMAAFTPALSERLGIFIPLIVVNCIILGRAEAFANKNTVVASICDALGMGTGYLIALLILASVRELLGDGKLLGYAIPPFCNDPALVMVIPPGGFLLFGCIMAWKKHSAMKGGKK